MVNVPPSQTFSVEVVERRINGLRRSAFYYLLKKEVDFQAGRVDSPVGKILAPFFTRTTSVIPRLQKVKLRVRSDAPCYDRRGIAFDGSASVYGRGKICLSAIRLAQKVDARQIEPQIMALMIHEFSEILGASEAEAIMIQYEVLRELAEVKPIHTKDNSDDEV